MKIELRIAHNRNEKIEEIFIVENSTICYFNGFGKSNKYIFDMTTGDKIDNPDLQKEVRKYLNY